MTERLHRHALPSAALSLATLGSSPEALVGCMDGVYRLHLEDGACERLYDHHSYVSGVALLASDTTCVSAGYDGRLVWYDLEARKQIREVEAHRFWSWQLAVSADRRRIASASGQYLAGGYKYEPAAASDPTVRVFDAESGEPLHEFSHLPPVQSVAFSPDGRRLAAANLMGDIRVWDLESGELAAEWNTDAFTSWGIIKSHCYIGGIYALLFTADGNHLLAAGMGPMRDPMAGNGRQLWQRFDLGSSPVAMIDQTHKGESGEGLMESLALHPSGKYFVMAGRLRGGDWNAALFSLADGSRVHSWKTGVRITSAAFSADGELLYLAGTDNQPRPENGRQKPFGNVDVYPVQVAS